MSHIVEAKTQIKNPNLALLRQAVELLAQQHPGGEIRDYYYTFERKQRRTSLALFTNLMRRGMAVEVKKGELTFIGDSYGYEEDYQQIQQQIVQTYVSLATMQALQALGYQTTAEDGEGGQVVIAGVTYA